MNESGHVMLSFCCPTLAVRYHFFTENVSILKSFVKEDADVDYMSLDLHLIKCTLVSVCDVACVCLTHNPVVHPLAGSRFKITATQQTSPVWVQPFCDKFGVWSQKER